MENLREESRAFWAEGDVKGKAQVGANAVDVEASLRPALGKVTVREGRDWKVEEAGL